MNYVLALQDCYIDDCLRLAGQRFWSKSPLMQGVTVAVPAPEAAPEPAPSVPIAVTTRDGVLPVMPAAPSVFAPAPAPGVPEPLPFDPNVVARMQREGAMNLDPQPRPAAGAAPAVTSVRLPETATPDTGADLFL